MMHSPLLLGISGYSGSGKTTLLEKLLPLLQQQNLRVGVIKHTHHNAYIDIPGKDSWRMKEAGATQVAIVSDKRWAIMTETANTAISLTKLATQFSSDLNDLILVEGFKQEVIPKILLHREKMSHPMPELDPLTIAIATDYPLDCKIPVLNINQAEQIALFIKHWWQQQRS